MTDEPSTLYAKLLGETAVIEWKALERFWAKGDLIWVDPSLDLIEVAQAMAENRSETFAHWRDAGTVGHMDRSCCEVPGMDHHRLGFPYFYRWICTGNFFLFSRIDRLPFQPGYPEPAEFPAIGRFIGGYIYVPSL